MKKLLFFAFFLTAGFAYAQRTVMSLNGSWQFDRTEKAFPAKKFTRTIPVPGLIHLATPRIADYDVWFKKPDAAETKEAHGVYDIDYVPMYNWYRKTVKIPAALQDKEAVLRIRKSQYVTQVYVNGIDMGTSMECYTPIEFHITKALKKEGENEILIKVGDRYWLPPQAAGSTDKEKEHYLPGIWDDVDLIFTGQVSANRVLLLPDLKSNQVTAKLRLRSFLPQQIMYGDPKHDQVIVKVELFEKEGKQAVASSEAELLARRDNLTETAITLHIPNPKKWSPDNPYLYTATTTVLINGTISDRRDDRFGMRDFERKGKFFYLNDEKILLRGTNITLQRFFEDPDCGDLAWNREWVKKLIIDDPKKINWNAMRICVGIVPDFWYDLADEYGMMFQNEWNYWQTHGWDEQIRQEYTNWVWSDGSHPSIVIWDAINENWDDYIGNVLIPELKQLDPTRIWDAGYMTASHMGNDEMDEPHPYEGFRPWSGTPAEYAKNPYPLGDLDYRNTTTLASIESGSAQLVNEYGWVWLWRNGKTAKLTNGIYSYYLGDISNPEINREFQAYWLQCETEWLRSIRQHAGVLAFTHLTNNYGYTGDWYINDIRNLEPGPTLPWFKHAFAPSAVFINHADQRYMKQFRSYDPGIQILFSLKAINDFSEKESGEVSIRLIDTDGKTVREQIQKIEVDPFGEKSYPVAMTLPGASGGYVLVTEFTGKLNPVKPQISRRYIRVGSGDYSYVSLKP